MGRSRSIAMAHRAMLPLGKVCLRNWFPADAPHRPKQTGLDHQRRIDHALSEIQKGRG